MLFLLFCSLYIIHLVIYQIAIAVNMIDICLQVIADGKGKYPVLFYGTNERLVRHMTLN